MNFIYGAVGKLLSRSSPRTRRRTRRQTARMDPTTRRALQTTVADETAAFQDDLEQVKRELDEAFKKFESAVEKEQFLGTRIRKYRTASDERARLLRKEREELAEAHGSSSRANDGAPETEEKEEIVAADEEEGRGEIVKDVAARRADFEKRMEQWERDEDLLTKIVHTHKQILVSCEEMRRTINQLEKKKKLMESMARECEDFLSTAQQAMQRQQRAEVEQLELGDQDGHLHEMEMANRESRDKETAATGHVSPADIDETAPPVDVDNGCGDDAVDASLGAMPEGKLMSES